jgi:hypothetical protein
MILHFMPNIAIILIIMLQINPCYTTTYVKFEIEKLIN